MNGLILRDGTWVHWPPHLENRFSDLAAKGGCVEVKGYLETGKKGETRLEDSTLTNLRTNKSVDNPDRPPRTGSALARRGEDVNERLQALQDQIDQLRREVQRLRCEK